MYNSIYIHIPFCRSKCLYCGFYSTAAHTIAHKEYVMSLVQEAQLRHIDDAQAKTVYLGGGTPTALAPALLEKVLSLGHGFAAPGAEYTVEVNPGTVTPEIVSLLEEHKVNRISCGIQSFNDKILQRLGRIHSVATAEKTVHLLQEQSSADISIDLMFAIPGQTLADWRESLERALALAPDHISLYGLTIEPGTVFEKHVAEGILQLADEDLYVAMYTLACTLLPDRGYTQYEISNFSRVHKKSKHNIAYWERKSYVGLGASAHSYIPNRRWWNVADVTRYNAEIHAGKLPEDSGEELSFDARRQEVIFLSLRMLRGIALPAFAQEFGSAAKEKLLKKVAPMLAHGLLVQDASSLRLSKEGLVVSDAIMAALI